MLQDIRHQKLRTLLTLFGITWGTVSVALLVAFGEGPAAADPEEHEGHGREHRDRLAGTHGPALRGPRQGPEDPVTEDDLEALRREIPERAASRASTREQRARFRRERARITPDMSATNSVFARDAQPHPRPRRPLRERPRPRPPAARRVPRRQAQAGPLRRRRRRRQDGDDRQRAVPGGRRDGEEGAGLELQRPRPGQGLHPGHDLQGPLRPSATSATSSSRRRSPRWCRA